MLNVLVQLWTSGPQHRHPCSESAIRATAGTGFLETADYDLLLDELAYFRPALIIGYDTGCGLGELMSLRWSDVNLASNEIVIRAEHSKNKRHRVLPIYGNMTGALAAQQAERDEKYPKLEWVFHDGNGNRLRTCYKAWHSACERAKLDGRLFHDLRRSACSGTWCAPEFRKW